MVTESNNGNMILYVVQSGEKGPVKIGICKDLKKRLYQLQTGSSVKLKVLYQYELTSKNAKEMEKNLHQFFRHTRLSGEWHRPTEYMMEYFSKAIVEDGQLYDGSQSFEDAVFNLKIWHDIEDHDHGYMQVAKGYADKGNYNAVEYIVGELTETLKHIHSLIPTGR